MALDKNLNKLGKLLAALDEDHLSKHDFEKAMQEVFDFLLKTNKINRDGLSKEAQKITEGFSVLKSDFEREVWSYREKLTQAERSSLSAIESRLGEIEASVQGSVQARLSELRDGESPAVEAIVEAMIPLIPAPIPGSPDSAEDIRNKLELLDGDDRLSIDAIRGLKELLEKKPAVTGGGIVGRDIFKDYDLSPYLDGVTKTFNIPAVWNIISVHTSSFPNALRKTVDFTYTPQTITFTDQIDAATTLAAGQTVILTIVTG